LNSNNTIISRNTVNYNEFTGIQLASSENCNISENNVNENSEGIFIQVSNNVIVSGNSINNNDGTGINLVLSNNNNITNNVINNNFGGVTINGGYNNTLSGNNMTECGVVLLGSVQEELTSYILDDTNLVNGNPLFCFINEIGLGKDNFTNPGQIILINCSDSLISGFNISHATMGIISYYCVNNSIYNNNISFCDIAGIGMWFCSNHVISGNSIELSGFFITGTPDSFYSNNFTSNMVNGKDFYYYVNETGLGKDNFTNPGQIFLINCNDSIVSNLNVSYATIGVCMLGKNITISNITASHNLIGVMMANSNDCIISDNTLNDNGWCGMYLGRNWNITIRNNIINENGIGIDFLFNCQYNNITENTINNNGRGIQIEGWGGNFDNNNISRNTINNNNREGILLQNSNNNTLLENTLNNNKDGLCLKYSNNNTISGNYIQNNVKNGIYLYNCNNNTILGNNINNNVLQGILLDENCFSNLFYVNYFIKNGIHVIDDLLNNNYWNNSDIGNFWDDYTGKDADNDGIGEIPHYFMNGVDYLPIWESLIPNIIINFPSDNLTFRSTAPNFEVVIKDETIFFLKNIVHIDTMWYTLDGGETNYTFITNGTINQGAWDVLPEGLVTLRFYANDTLVIIFKDTTAPDITIHSPEPNQVFGSDAPEFNLTIVDDSLINSIWYTIDGGETNYTISGLTGTINQNAWNSASQGEILIVFYAEDITGNIGTSVVTVIKSIPSQPPIPGYNMFIIIGTFLVFIAIVIIYRIKKRSTL